MAVGAERGDILKLVVRQGFRLALIGVGIGAVGGLGLTRFVASLLYGVRPTDPVTFTAASILLVAVAVLASYFPGRRVTKLDTAAVLRCE
jgi:ABC-type antimicrobial peptide transport system permease subunit